MKKLTAALLTVLAGLLLLQGCSAEEGSAQADEVSGATDYAPLVASAVPVRESVLRDRVVGSGIIEGRQEAVVRTRTAGTIRSISFELGQTFSRGDVLLTLDDTVSSLQLRQLELQRDDAQADLESKQALFSRGGLSERELNQAKASLDGIDAQLTQVRESVEAARVSTPISGRVSQRSPNLVIGDQLAAGTQIARIVDLESLRVTLSVGQSQVFQIREGARAEVRIQVPGRVLTAEGTVTAISAGSDLRTGSWSVVVDAPNPAPEVLRAGMTAEVVIFQEDAPAMPIVPGAALVYRDGRAGVFIVENGQAKLVHIDVIDEYGEFASVSAADESISLIGKSVLVSGLSQLRSGDAAVTGPTNSN